MGVGNVKIGNCGYGDDKDWKKLSIPAWRGMKKQTWERRGMGRVAGKMTGIEERSPVQAGVARSA